MIDYSFDLNNTIGTINQLDWKAVAEITCRRREDGSGCLFTAAVTIDLHLQDYYSWDGLHNLPIAVGSAFMDKFNRIYRIDRLFTDEPYLQNAANFEIENHTTIHRTYSFSVANGS